MKVVLLSGGSGKRLWPLSNDARAKQFLKVLNDNEGKKQSMVQRVWGQLEKSGLADDSFISTSKSQVEVLENQLENKVNLIVEPSRRDTFPAIALAISYIYTHKNIDREEVIAILPVDPYVEDLFFEQVRHLENVLNESNADIALIGVTPTYPSTKYGYILPSNDDSEIKPVLSFSEKPSEDKAEKLIEEGALWNCGVFAFKAGFLLDLLEEKKYPVNYKELLSNYEVLPKISFDYEVLEKSNNIVVTPYKGCWKDLGTWNTLTEEMSSNKVGKGILSEDSINTHLINELDIPINIIGVKDLIVAASPDGIIVSEKESSPRIKDLLKGDDTMPMYEERRWGWYKVLDYTKIDNGNEVLTKRICIEEGKNLSYQQHYARSEVWTVIKGDGELVIDGHISKVKSGDVIEIPVKAKHALRAVNELEIIEVQRGSHLIEEDIIRIENNWEIIMEICEENKSVIK